MKKLSQIALAALAVALAAPVAFAQDSGKLTGTVELSSAAASVSAPYADGHIHSASALFDLEGNNKLGVSLTNVDAWGEKANYINVRHLRHLNKDRWVDVNAGFSDKGNITAERRVSVMFNEKFADIATIVGVGVDYYTMRSGGSATTVRTQAVKYVTGMPLVLQGGLDLTNSSMNSRSGHRLNLAATYGHVGNWTVTAMANTGRVHYELETRPGAVADYNSRTVGVGGRYWVDKNWGVSVNVGKVSNRYYTREEVRAGVFINF